MSSGDFIRNLRLTLLSRCRCKEVQSVFLVVSLGGGNFLITVVLRLIITGVLSDVSSAFDSIVQLFLLFPLITKKSSRSGVFLGSLGQ
jgi:hypothetical protein